nr:hypothetical protein [Tanacetum cinerariifolium]
MLAPKQQFLNVLGSNAKFGTPRFSWGLKSQAQRNEEKNYELDNLYKLLLVQVIDAPTILVSAEENLGDPIDIRVDIIHPEPVTTVAFPAAAVVRTQAQHGEAIQGILEHLQGVPIEEEMSNLRFKMGMAEAENAFLHGKIKTMEAIKTITRSQKKRDCMEMERQLASVQESQRHD